jgi:hypothetical protein
MCLVGGDENGRSLGLDGFGSAVVHVGRGVVSDTGVAVLVVVQGQWVRVRGVFGLTLLVD